MGYSDKNKKEYHFDTRWCQIPYIAAMKLFFKQFRHRLAVYQLPGYSPDFNPIEKLWKNIKKDEIHLHYFPDFDSLKQKVELALLHFADKQKDILDLFGFYKKIKAA